MARYAARTSVSVEKSEAEIRKIVLGRGASEFGSAIKREDDGRATAVIAFTIDGKRVRFSMRFPGPKDKQFTETATGRERSEAQALHEWDVEVRRRYRALKIYILSKFEAVDAEITTFEEAFLPYMLMPGGKTIGEHTIPQIPDICKGKKFPELMPGLGE